MVEHYWEHKQLNPEMSLTAFLKTHYENPVKDADYGKDHKLPFIIHTTPLALIFIMGEAFRLEIRNHHLRIIKSGKIPSQNDAFCYKGFLRTAWEPPKYLFS